VTVARTTSAVPGACGVACAACVIDGGVVSATCAVNVYGVAGALLGARATFDAGARSAASR
jgi:hypothetical protein